MRTLDQVLADIAAERFRQEDLRRKGRFRYTCADGELSLTEKLAVLTEEVGEFARETMTQNGRRLARDTRGTPEGLYREIIQVAAVAAAIAEGL